MGERIQQGAGTVGPFSLLNRPTQITPDSSTLTPLQKQVDGLVGGFVRESTHLSTLAAMVGGGLSYRLGRAGVMSISALRAVPLKPLSVIMGLGAEVVSFEGLHRSLISFTDEGRQNPNLFRWKGEGGLRQGFLTSLVTFGALKGAGNLVQGENIILQHLVQDSAMVLAHQASGSLGWTSKPSGSLAEQFLHAEATNLQLGSGAALAHGLTPGMYALERAMDLPFGFGKSEEEATAPLLKQWAIQGLVGSEPVASPLIALQMEKLEGVGGGALPEKEDPPFLPLLRRILEQSGKKMAGPSEILETLLRPLEEVGNGSPDKKKDVLEWIRKDFQIMMEKGKGVPIEHYYFRMKRLLFIAEHHLLYEKYGLKDLLEQNVLGSYDRYNFNRLPQSGNEFWYPAEKDQRFSISYSPQAEAWMAELELQLKRASEEWPRLFSKEEALARRVDENLVAKVWNYQLLHFAGQMGAWVSIKDAECLVDSFHPDALPLNDEVLSKALSAMEGLDPETRLVFELKIPYQDVVFGKKDQHDATLAGVPHLLKSFQYSLNGNVRLVHETPEGNLILRIPSPSLLERLLESVQGDRAPRFYYLDGEVSRDEMMRAREMGVALIGLVRNPVVLGDIEALIPPWGFPFHDIFHAHAVSRYDAPIRRFAASLYRLAAAHASELSPFVETHLNRLVDFDQGPRTYFRYILKHLLEKSGAPLEERINFVRTYQRLLENFSPSDPFQAFFLRQFRKELQSVETKLNRKRRIEVLFQYVSSLR